MADPLEIALIAATEADAPLLANLLELYIHDLSEAFRLASRVIAFERPRNRPEELERYGATLSTDLVAGETREPSAQGATITRDIEIWPQRVARTLKQEAAQDTATPDTAKPRS